MAHTTYSANQSPPTSTRTSGKPATAAVSKPGPTASPYWNEDGLSEDEVWSYIHREHLLNLNEYLHGNTDNLRENDKSENAGPDRRADSPPSVPQFEHLDSGSWQDAPNSKCHASFGDEGTTATIGTFGQLLQFSSFLGAGSSGMFSADHISVQEPRMASSRARDLQQLSDKPFHFGSAPLQDPPYGLKFPGLALKPSAEPRLAWIHWRWPRHEYSLGDFESHPNVKLTIQWMVHEKTILQRCVLQNHGYESLKLDLEFSMSMIVRDLDHHNHHSMFNREGRASRDIGPGPMGYGCVCVQMLNAARLTEAVRKDASPFLSTQGPEQEENSAEPNRPHSEDLLKHQPNRTACLDTEQIQDPYYSSDNSQSIPKSADGIFVIASVAIDGIVQKLGVRTPQRWTLDLRPPGADGQIQTLEVTAAYKMQLLTSLDTDWRSHIISWNDMKVNQLLWKQQPAQRLPIGFPMPPEETAPNIPDTKSSEKDNRIKDLGDMRLPVDNPDGDTRTRQTQFVPMEPPVGTPDKSSSPQNHLNFSSRRTLEHILSVCAIPATPKGDDSSLPEDLREVKAVALTCGDLSGHRICWSASFFAFRFLAEYYKFLRGLPKDLHDVSSLLQRIESTCHGHLKWLHLLQQQQSGQRFGPKYWVTGNLIITHESSESAVAGYSLADTGFQILKAAACMDLWGKTIAADLMSQWATSWLTLMETSDKRRLYTWPHAKYAGFNTFRLDEHIWVWRALKALEMEDHEGWNRMSKKAHPIGKVENIRGQGHYQLSASTDGQEALRSTHSPSSKDDIARLHKIFASEIVRREVTKRFTTENDTLRKRMIAVTRSPRRTRFLLHDRDTALFYDEASNFFSEDPSTQELWTNTINCQPYHHENQGPIWERPLRYALCIMMGTRGLSINEKPSDLLVQTATEAIFRSSSPNGIFPSCFQEQYFNSHASFEIPYILLTHSNRVVDVYRRLARSRIEGKKLTPNLSARLEDNASLHGPKSIHQFPQAQCDTSLLTGDAEQRQVLLQLSNCLLGRSTLSYSGGCEGWSNVGRVANHQRLIVKKDMPFNDFIETSSIVELEDEWLFNYPEFFARKNRLDIARASKCLKNKLHGSETSSGRIPSTRDIGQRLSFCIANVHSSRLTEGHRNDDNCDYHFGRDCQVLQELITPVRTQQKSKRRLLYFAHATEEAASICYATTEESDQCNMLEFFERHSRYAKLSMDKCSMLDNSWETEFHLSYYQLLEKSEKPWVGIPPFESESFPGGRGKQIARVSTSFRFKGDLFDRFWTCHWLEYIHVGSKSIADRPHIRLSSKKDRQRKVLEQLFVSEILESLTDSTGEILKEIKVCLGIESGSFSTSIPSNDAYSFWSALWQEFEPLLRTLEEDLAIAQATFKQWVEKEKERGVDRPRWTRGDERKYGASIMAIRRDIKHQMHNLDRLHANVDSLHESCSKHLARAREELSFRSDQNIATFTYVTVVFLPLGFAASIFSMSGTPETALVISMVTASLVALAITVLALVNGNVLAKMLDTLSSEFSKLTAAAKRSSVLMRNWKRLENKGTTSNPDDLGNAVHYTSRTVTASWNLIFWTGYIFVEVPAWIITVACRTIVTRHPLARGVHHSLLPTMAIFGEPMTHLVPRPQPGRPKKFVRVVLGLLALPVFLVTWIFQCICFNVWDVLALLGELIRKALTYIASSVIDRHEDLMITRLTEVPQYLRPMHMIKKHIQTKKKSAQPEALDKQQAGR